MLRINERTLEDKTLDHLGVLAVNRVVEGGEAPHEVTLPMGLCSRIGLPLVGFVLRHRKTNGVSKRPLRKNESMRRMGEEDVAGMERQPLFGAAFFGIPIVAYAKDYAVIAHRRVAGF
jgi:hypothetical protein